MGIEYTAGSASDTSGFTEFPNPEFCMYTIGIFLVARWYPAARLTAAPSFEQITCLSASVLSYPFLPSDAHA